MNNDFKVGDHVIWHTEFDNLIKGRIMGEISEYWAFEADANERFNGHNCAGTLNSSRGWYVHKKTHQNGVFKKEVREKSGFGKFVTDQRL